MFLSLNIEQAAWYVERDGATLQKAEADGSLVYHGIAAGGWYHFRIPAHLVDEFNTRRDRIYARLAAKRREQAAR